MSTRLKQYVVFNHKTGQIWPGRLFGSHRQAMNAFTAETGHTSALARSLGWEAKKATIVIQH